MPRKRAVVDPSLKERALKLAEEHGAAFAARETGLKAASIRGWRSRAKPPVPPVPRPVALSGDAAVMTVATVESVLGEAQQMLRAMRKARLASERMMKADRGATSRDFAVSAGIFSDKAVQLRAFAETLQVVAAQITDVQASRLREGLRAFFEAAGIGVLLAHPAAIETLQAAMAGEHLDPVLVGQLRELLRAEVEHTRRRALPPVGEVLHPDGEQAGGEDEDFDAEEEPADAEVVASEEPQVESRLPPVRETPVSPADQALGRLARRTGTNMAKAETGGFVVRRRGGSPRVGS